MTVERLKALRESIRRRGTTSSGSVFSEHATWVAELDRIIKEVE